QIALGLRQVMQLLAAELTDAALVAGETGEEATGRDIVIFHDALARRLTQQVQPGGPTDGVMIDEDRFGIVAQERGQFRHVPRVWTFLDPVRIEQADGVALGGENALHFQRVVADGVTGGNAQADNSDSAHAVSVPCLRFGLVIAQEAFRSSSGRRPGRVLARRSCIWLTHASNWRICSCCCTTRVSTVCSASPISRSESSR